jgi:hypothetical protein
VKKQCPETCPECRGRGEVDLLTKVVPCSQSWAARGGPIPLSKVSSLVESLAPQVKERLAESFRQAYPGARLLEQMASLDGEAFRREYQGEFVPNQPKSHKEVLALQCQSIVERHGGSITIEHRRSGDCVVHAELDGERFEEVSTDTLRKIFYMHHYGAGTRVIANALREVRGRPAANFQNPPTNPCAEISISRELLFLGGPWHGQFHTCPPFGRVQTYGDVRDKVNPLRPSRVESSSMLVFTYVPQTIVVGGKRTRVMILDGDDVRQHVCFLEKLSTLLTGGLG